MDNHPRKLQICVIYLSDGQEISEVLSTELKGEPLYSCFCPENLEKGDFMCHQCCQKEKDMNS